MKEKETRNILFFSFNTFCFPNNIEVKLDSSKRKINKRGGLNKVRGGGIRKILISGPPPCIKHPRVPQRSVRIKI